jgi:hypothetical protein
MKHFTLEELTRSDTALRLGIDNTPPPSVVQNLHHLVEVLLDPLREAFGKPIYVNSGYRCPALNTAVGGSRNSQHIQGQAADIRPHLNPPQRGGVATRGEANAELGRLLIDLNLPFDQLIIYPTFLHVSWRHTPRHQVHYR